MASSSAGSRRTFLKTASLAAAGGLLARPVVAASPAAGSRRGPAAAGLKLGVASYSLRKLSAADAIAAVQALRTPYINLKSFHLPYELSTRELIAARRRFEGAGLQIVGGGTITLAKDEDDDIRRYFEYAKAAGMPLMVIAPRPENLPRIEKFVKAYDIKAAIHNHGPEDRYFPAPADALRLIRNMDPRMGVCLDIGHTVRTGTDAVAAAAEAGARLLDVHMKDLRDLSDKNSQSIVGEGSMPTAAFFRQLQAMRYAGYVNLEYEIDADDPLPGMQRSFAYMRGVLDGLAPQ